MPTLNLLHQNRLCIGTKPAFTFWINISTVSEVRCNCQGLGLIARIEASILVFDTKQVLYWPVLGQIQFCSFYRRCKPCLDTKPVLYQGRFCSLTAVLHLVRLFQLVSKGLAPPLHIPATLRWVRVFGQGTKLFGKALAYIADLLQPYELPRKFHSTDKQFLSPPPCHLKSYGDRAFCCAAPFFWKNIPHNVTTRFIVSHLHDMWPLPVVI